MGAIAREQIAYLAELNGKDLGWFDEVCTDIAQGATLDQAYAKASHSVAVPWPVIRMWFKPNEALEAKYQDALAARLEWRREQAAANVMAIASVEHEFVKPSDTLRAAELVLGAGGSSGISVGVGSGSGRVKIEVEFVGASDG